MKETTREPPLKMEISRSKVSISNKILNARYSLTMVEKRILSLAMSQMNTWKESPTEAFYYVYAEDYASILGVSVENAYEVITNSCQKLFDRVIVLKNPTTKKLIQLRWVITLETNPEQKSIGVRWHPDIMSFMSELRQDYTKLYLDEILPIDSVYASRLYEFIYQSRYRGLIGQVSTTVLEIQERWELPPSRCEYKFLKSKILLPAIQELKDKNLVLIEIHEPRKRNVFVINFRYQFFQTEEDWRMYKENLVLDVAAGRTPYTIPWDEVNKEELYAKYKSKKVRS